MVIRVRASRAVRRCWRCKENVPSEQVRPDGECKPCHYVALKDWRRRNPEIYREANARAYYRNKEKRLKSHLRYQEKNQDLVRAFDREYISRMRRGKAYNQVNPETGVMYGRLKTVRRSRRHCQEQTEDRRR
jgi:hypothetical protein